MDEHLAETRAAARDHLLATIGVEGVIVYLLERRRSRTNLTRVVDLKVVTLIESTKTAPATGESWFCLTPTIVSIGQAVAAVHGLEYEPAERGIVFKSPVSPELIVAMVSRDLFDGRRDALRMEWL